MRNTFFIFLIMTGMLSGCGGEKAPEVTNASTPENVPAASSAPQAPTVGPGIIRGKVLFNGTVPAPAALDMAADPVCSGAHPEPFYSEELTVDSATRGIRDAFVYVKEGIPPGAVYSVPADPVMLDQKGCHYTPHVFGVRANQTITIINSDATLHNVHAQSKNSREFNLGMPLQGMKSTKKFENPEVMAHFKCDVHPWMSAYAGVMEHPFFAVSAADGSFEIKGLPEGQYALAVWHEKLGVQNFNVEVASGVSEVTVNYGN